MSGFALGNRGLPLSQDDQGKLIVAIKNVEEVTFVNAQAVTDITERTVLMAGLEKFREFDIHVQNSHNQPARIIFKRGSINMRFVNNDGTLTAMNRTSVYYEIPASTSTRLPLSLFDMKGAPPTLKDQKQWQRYRAYQLSLEYSFATAPTSGSITVVAEGVPN